MTTILSKKGQLVLPALLRKRLHLKSGDDFEVYTENEDTIILRRISKPANFGFVKMLCSAPFAFEVPERDKDDTKPLRL